MPAMARTDSRLDLEKWVFGSHAGGSGHGEEDKARDCQSAIRARSGAEADQVMSIMNVIVVSRGQRLSKLVVMCVMVVALFQICARH